MSSIIMSQKVNIWIEKKVVKLMTLKLIKENFDTQKDTFYPLRGWGDMLRSQQSTHPYTQEPVVQNQVSIVLGIYPTI